MASRKDVSKKGVYSCPGCTPTDPKLVFFGKNQVVAHYSAALATGRAGHTAAEFQKLHHMSEAKARLLYDKCKNGALRGLVFTRKVSKDLDWVEEGLEMSAADASKLLTELSVCKGAFGRCK